MSETRPHSTGYARAVAIALPVVFSNALMPLQGAVDTAVIGNLGTAGDLAAVTLGAAVVQLVVAVFNFLQMGSSGLTAQALGAGNRARAMNTLARALILAAAIGLLLVILKLPLRSGLLALFGGSPEVKRLAALYLDIRLWAVPAELMNFALMGWFAGQGLTRRLFEMQLAVSAVNIALTLVLVVGLGLGVAGVALGTAVAVGVGTAVGLWRARARARDIAPAGWRPEPRRLLRGAELRRVLALSRDILIRTTLLTASFAWVARLGSLQGDAVLAANGILLQFLHLAAYGLDGFALAAEALVGRAMGVGRRSELRAAIRASLVPALGLAALIALAFTAGAGALVGLFTDLEEIRAIARAHAFWATLLPLVAVLAYILDGVFIGATAGPEMRNAMILSAGIFFPLGWAMTEAAGNHGLWAALWIWMALRAGTLAAQLPRVAARLAPA